MSVSSPSGRPAASAATQGVQEDYGKLPLSFVPNGGQDDPRVRYTARSAGLTAFFTARGAVLSLAAPAARTPARTYALGLSFLGANPAPTIVPGRLGSGEANFFVGNDPSRWRTGLRTAGELTYRALWPGVDMAVRGDDQRLKYEFHLAAGARPDAIRLAYRGADGLSLDGAGNLRIATPARTLTDSAPISYQSIAGRRVSVASHFVLGPGSTYGIEVGAYDARYPLIIDPSIVYSTYLGGSGQESAYVGVAVDVSGNAYAVGQTDSPNFPTTLGAFQTSPTGSVFVSKLNASGTALVYSTYLSGTSGGAQSHAIAVDASGSAYVTGGVDSMDFPTTSGAFQETRPFGATSAFVTKLNPSGSSLAYSTYLGKTVPSGSYEYGMGIALDGAGAAYVGGYTNDSGFPTTPGAFQTANAGADDAFVTKLNAAGSALVYSTFVGGSGYDVAFAIAVDGLGGAYIAGGTQSSDLPTTVGSFQPARGPGGAGSVFVTKLDPSGAGLDYSTYLGPSAGEEGDGIAVDASGSAYVTGRTNSNVFPTTPGAYQTSQPGVGSADAFVSKLDASGSALVYSTYLAGANGAEFGQGIRVDGAGNAYVAGITNSTDFPTTVGAFQTTQLSPGSDDAFVTKLNASGSGLLYSSYLGGSSFEVTASVAVDGGGDAYVAGSTNSSDFPTTVGAFQSASGGGQDTFVAKLGTVPPPTPAPPGAPTIGNVVAGDGAVSVSFGPAPRGSADTSGYRAQCSSPNGASGSNQDTSSPIVVPGLTNGATYTCSVLAWNSVGNGPSSDDSGPVTPTPTSQKMDDCTDDTQCQATIPQPPTKLAPAQSATVVGTPSDETGTVVLTGTRGTLGCDSINGSKPGPITELFDEGFSPTTRLTITMTLKIASSTTPGQICYDSEIPFFSQESPNEKQAGTGYLLLCSVKNVAPCVVSSQQVGANIVVKFVVPGGDPRFCVLLPKGRLQWLAGSALAKVATAFNAQLQSTGGRAPVHWKIASGKLPAGLALNRTTGAIAGKPKAKGSQKVVVAGTDSASPPKTAKLSIPFKVM